MLNTRYGILVIIMFIFIEMLTCNSRLYCLYLFIFYTWIFVYLLISFILFAFIWRFQNKVLPWAGNFVDGEDIYSQLLQLFTGKETIVLKSLPAVVVLYFTASEKENLRTERKQNYLIKNENKKQNKNETSDYYYLSNRKRSKYSSLLE